MACHICDGLGCSHCEPSLTIENSALSTRDKMIEAARFVLIGRCEKVRLK